MTDQGSGRLVSHVAELWEVVPWVGIVTVVGSVMYLRGRWAESGLSAQAWSQQAADAGLYWPIAAFSIGMAMMALWLLVGVYYGRS